MRAIILAAGRGRRMKGLTDDRPKCLIDVQGKPLLEWQIESLRQAGITRIGIVTGYKRELLTGWGLEEFHNPRWADTNMVSSLACAAAWLEKDVCIVSYSDIFYRKEAAEVLMESEAALSLTYDIGWRALWTKRFGDPLLDAETFRIASDGTLLEIGNKPGSLDEIQGQYMGLLRFAPEGWKEVERIRAGLEPGERDNMHMTGTLQRVIEAGCIRVIGLPYSGRWGEVDSAEDLAAY